MKEVKNQQFYKASRTAFAALAALSIAACQPSRPERAPQITPTIPSPPASPYNAFSEGGLIQLSIIQSTGVFGAYTPDRNDPSNGRFDLVLAGNILNQSRPITPKVEDDINPLRIHLTLQASSNSNIIMETLISLRGEDIPRISHTQPIEGLNLRAENHFYGEWANWEMKRISVNQVDVYNKERLASNEIKQPSQIYSMPLLP
jgi:hypothetical protein